LGSNKLCVLFCEGNKSDLVSIRQVPFDEVAGFADRNQVFRAMETSAKENVNIEETFIELARVTSDMSGLTFYFIGIFAYSLYFISWGLHFKMQTLPI